MNPSPEAYPVHKSICVVALLLAVAFLTAVKSNDDDGINPHHPVIVAEKDVLQVTGTLTQDLFTPTQDGNFRIDAYLNQQPLSGSGPALLLFWTDEFGTQQTSVGINTLSGATGVEASGGQIFVHALAGHPIQLETLGPPSPYNIHITVERM